MEDQLAVDVIGDGRGGIELRGHIGEAAGNRLSFAFRADAGVLPAALRAIDALLATYPVR